MTVPDFLKVPQVVSKNIWGTLEFKEKEKVWVMKGHPQAAAVLKRMFPASQANGHGEVQFSTTKRTVGDINWFLMKYPLNIKQPDVWYGMLKEAQDYFEKREAMLDNPIKITPSKEGPMLKKFYGELKEFQKEGLAFLLHNERALLADQMGLGKTPMALAWLTTIPDPPPYLIITPPHLLNQWSRQEIPKFLGTTEISWGKRKRSKIFQGLEASDGNKNIRVHIIQGQKIYDLPDADIIMIHYLLLHHWREVLSTHEFGAVIFDEIHELRRGEESNKYSAASLIAESVAKVIGLSGTPFYNLGGEMWWVLNGIERNCLGDFGGFTREWCGGWGNPEISDPHRFNEYLKHEGLFLRRTKEEVMSELPPKRRVVHDIDSDEAEYDDLIGPVINQAKELLLIKEDFGTGGKGRLTQEVIDQTRLVTGYAKAKFVAAFVRTLLEAGEPCILYGHHHVVMDVYMDELKDYHPVMISGRQTQNQKTEAQELFMKEEATDLMIVALRCGTGLNLQRARCVVFGELDWSPQVMCQCEDRAHRIGVRDSVLCYYLVCNQGTDPIIMDALGLKTSQFVGVMGDREETEQDKEMAQIDVKKHMATVIKSLQEGGKARIQPDAKTLERLKYLENVPRKSLEEALAERVHHEEDEEEVEEREEAEEKEKAPMMLLDSFAVKDDTKGEDDE